MDGFRAQWERAYPGAVACLVEDFESLSVHLRFPKEHWKRCRHTNLIERTFGDYADVRIMPMPAFVDRVRPVPVAAPSEKLGIIRAA
jgi:transposase-like protein